MTIENITWFHNIFNNIHNETKTVENLKELKIALSALSPTHLAQLTPNLDLNVLFDSINSSDKEQTLLSAEILGTLLPSLHSNTVLNRYGTSLKRALIHPVTEVKEIALKELIRDVSDKELLNIVNQDSAMLINIVTCLCDEELSVANEAIEFLTKFGSMNVGLASICHPSIKLHLIEKTQQSEIYKIRLYQIIIDISVKSKEALLKLAEHGLVEDLLKLLTSDDVLARLAIIEEVTKLVMVPHGYEFMKNKGIIDSLANQFKMSCDALSAMAFPGLLKFFGNIGQKYPEIFSSYTNILQAIFQAVDSDDLPVSVTALETIGFLAASSSGKELLAKQDAKYMKQVMGRMQNATTNLPIEWRLKALIALCSIMHTEDNLETLEKITETWFSYLGVNGLDTLANMAKQPFPDVKLAAMRVILELAPSKWGMLKINNCQGLVDFLLDRSTETTLEGMQIKYDTIKAIVKSPYAQEIFREYDYSGMQEYVTQGVCFSPVALQVEVEGQN